MWFRMRITRLTVAKKMAKYPENCVSSDFNTPKTKYIDKRVRLAPAIVKVGRGGGEVKGHRKKALNAK